MARKPRERKFVTINIPLSVDEQDRFGKFVAARGLVRRAVARFAIIEYLDREEGKEETA